MYYEFLREKNFKNILKDLNFNNVENINININKSKLNDENYMKQSKILYFEDKKGIKLSLFNVIINIIEPKNKMIYSEINALEKLNEIKFKKNIKTLLYIDNNGFEKKEKKLKRNIKKEDFENEEEEKHKKKIK